ncbi:MAG: Wzt carbohydrate-binding domain-containing protein, partial [bacterium]
KCLNKIAELKEQDRTIVLVSHTMPSILQHSSRVLWIDHGSIKAYGDPEETVERYLRTVHSHGTGTSTQESATTSDSPIQIASVTVRNASGHTHKSLSYGEPAYVDIEYRVVHPIEDPVVALTFHDVRDYPLGGLTTRFDKIRLDSSEGTGVVRLILAPVLFTRGSYGVTVAIQDSRIQRYLDMRPRAATFMVEGPSVASREVTGHFVFPHRWETNPPNA